MAVVYCRNRYQMLRTLHQPETHNEPGLKFLFIERRLRPRDLDAIALVFEPNVPQDEERALTLVSSDPPPAPLPATPEKKQPSNAPPAVVVPREPVQSVAKVEVVAQSRRLGVVVVCVGLALLLGLGLVLLLGWK